MSDYLTTQPLCLLKKSVELGFPISCYHPQVHCLTQCLVPLVVFAKRGPQMFSFHSSVHKINKAENFLFIQLFFWINWKSTNSLLRFWTYLVNQSNGFTSPLFVLFIALLLLFLCRLGCLELLWGEFWCSLNRPLQSLCRLFNCIINHKLLFQTK